MASDLAPSDLALLLRAAKAARLDPAKLRAANPWVFHGPTAKTVQAAVMRLDPDAAKRLEAAAAVGLSLGAAAERQGLAV